MTVETNNTNTDTKLVASLIKTASEKPLIANSFSLVAGTYSKVSSFVKPVCPTSISTRWEAAETYLVDNQDSLVASADEYVAVASKFVNDVNEARANKQATEFILTTVEDLVKDEEAVEEEENKAEEPKATTTRIYGITGAVSKSFYKKATSGLENLNKRTTDVVHVDLMNYANTFIDGSVKPQYDYVAGLPTAVSEKFTAYAEPVKAKALVASDKVQLALKDIVIAPAKIAYDMKTKEEKNVSEIVVALVQHGRVQYNDYFVAPFAAYLDVPNLKYDTLKPLIVDYANKKYSAATDYANTQYSTVTEFANAKKSAVVAYGTEKYNTTSESVLNLLNSLTATPIAELKYAEIPASVYTKLSGEFADRYLEYTGKEFDVKTAPVIVYALVLDYVKPYLAVKKEKAE